MSFPLDLLFNLRALLCVSDVVHDVTHGCFITCFATVFTFAPTTAVQHAVRLELLMTPNTATNFIAHTRHCIDVNACLHVAATRLVAIVLATRLVAMVLVTRPRKLLHASDSCIDDGNGSGSTP